LPANIKQLEGAENSVYLMQVATNIILAGRAKRRPRDITLSKGSH